MGKNKMQKIEKKFNGLVMGAVIGGAIGSVIGMKMQPKETKEGVVKRATKKLFRLGQKKTVMLPEEDLKKIPHE